MKLLSMKAGGRNRAGIVVGDEALDVTEFTEGAEGEFHDAIDLYRRGAEWLQQLMARLESGPHIKDQCRRSGSLVPLSEARLNPPVLAPGKIFAVGLNYAAHAAEQNTRLPETPLIFTKNVTALVGPEDVIRLPRISDKIDYEAELAVVIGREVKNISADRALDYVAGYTIMNDVTARDLQQRERQWARAKGLDTFAPCGPWLVTRDEIADPHSLAIELRVNGEVRQSSNTDDLIFKLPEIIEFVSQDLTLRAGDIITTGTPSGVGVFLNPPVFLKPGDRIEIDVEKIGRLTNPVS